MEIYLDANATTPVLPQAQAAAMAVMQDLFGNPSSVHGAGLRARVVLDQARTAANKVIGAAAGRVVFTSGATEGIQTAVLSALLSIRARLAEGAHVTKVLYGATEHKAVPEAIKHWKAVLDLDLDVLSIPVGIDGLHDLAWLAEHLPEAGLVCTMAANNETGVVSDLEAINTLLIGSPTLWLVDGVQALGKLDLKLAARRIDYAPFSGHKLYAPKGIGMLYVRDGAPFTALVAGGGQESALRSGTENMTGIAALGAVLTALETEEVFASNHEMTERRALLAAALKDAFPGLVFNAPLENSLPTTLNFSVPGVSSKVLLDLFDAAGMRVSGGSACGASKAQPSYVLQAMGLPEWQTSSAVRLSFGAADSGATIEAACERIRQCGAALRASCRTEVPSDQPSVPGAITRFLVDGACCYVVADAPSMRCIIIDPLPELTEQLVQWVSCRGLRLVAVLDTHSHGDHESSAPALRRAAMHLFDDGGAGDGLDGLGWPVGAAALELGKLKLSRMAIPGHTEDSVAYVLRSSDDLLATFVGDTVMPGALGRSDFPQSAPLKYGASLRSLADALGAESLLLPGHDYDNRFATTLGLETEAQPLLAAALNGRLSPAEFAAEKETLEKDLPLTEFQTVVCGARVKCTMSESVEFGATDLKALLEGGRVPLVVDVREDYEAQVGSLPDLDAEHVSLSGFLNSLPRLRALPSDKPVVFVCRSGNRSAQAARALRRLGHAQAWSLSGGLALWPSSKTVLATSAN